MVSTLGKSLTYSAFLSLCLLSGPATYADYYSSADPDEPQPILHFQTSPDHHLLVERCSSDYKNCTIDPNVSATGYTRYTLLQSSKTLQRQGRYELLEGTLGAAATIGGATAATFVMVPVDTTGTVLGEAITQVGAKIEADTGAAEKD